MKTPLQRLLMLVGSLGCLVFCSCATNAVPEDSHAFFTQREDYPKTSLYWKNKELYAQASPETTRIQIDTGKQRGFLIHNEQVVIDYPICSGRTTHPTPKGLFNILEKKEEKSSNRYGRIYDAEGKMINGDADVRTDEVPEGGEFVGAPMPYWMRLTYDGIGHHIGPTLRRPVSHGCIRGPRKVMPLVFAKVKKGTEVIVDEPSARVKKYSSGSKPKTVKTQTVAVENPPASTTAQ